MKKACSVLLMAVLILSLCSCKSRGAQAVDDLILSIEDVTIDNIETVENARKAYEALSENKKAQIENLTTLEELERNAFQKQYANFAWRLKQLDENCGYVCSLKAQLFYVFGDDFIDFALSELRSLDSIEEVENYREKDEDLWAILLRAILCTAVYPEYTYDDASSLIGSWSSNDSLFVEEPTQICVKYNEAYEKATFDVFNKLEEDVKIFIDKYDAVYPQKIEALRKWYANIIILRDLTWEINIYDAYESELEECLKLNKQYAATAEAYY